MYRIIENLGAIEVLESACIDQKEYVHQDVSWWDMLKMAENYELKSLDEMRKKYWKGELI